MPRKAPKEALETRSRRIPKSGTKMGQKWNPKWGPRRGQIGAKRVTKGVQNRTLEQEGSKRASGEPKRAPRGPQESPKGRQEGRKRAPRERQESPRGSKEAPREPRRVPRGSREGHRRGSTLKEDTYQQLAEGRRNGPEACKVYKNKEFRNPYSLFHCPMSLI